MANQNPLLQRCLGLCLFHAVFGRLQTVPGFHSTLMILVNDPPIPGSCQNQVHPGSPGMRQADASSIVPRGRHSPVVVAAVQQPVLFLQHFGILLQKESESDLLDAKEAWVDQHLLLRQ